MRHYTIHCTLRTQSAGAMHQDMGPDLADKVREGDASGSEWRTPPLWSLGLVEQKAEARFLHDGRAHTINQAIRWHGGEAQRAKARYNVLSDSDQALQLEFIRGL